MPHAFELIAEDGKQFRCGQLRQESAAVKNEARYTMKLHPVSLYIEDPKYGTQSTQPFTVQPGRVATLRANISAAFGLSPDEFSLCTSPDLRERLVEPIMFTALREGMLLYISRHDKRVDVWCCDAPAYDHLGRFAPPHNSTQHSFSIAFGSDPTRNLADVIDHFGVDRMNTKPAQRIRFIEPGLPDVEELRWETVSNGDRLMLCRPAKTIIVEGDCRLGDHPSVRQVEQIVVKPERTAEDVWAEIVERLHLPELCRELWLGDTATAAAFRQGMASLQSAAGGTSCQKRRLAYGGLRDCERLSLRLHAKRVTVRLMWLNGDNHYYLQSRFSEHNYSAGDEDSDAVERSTDVEPEYTHVDVLNVLGLTASDLLLCGPHDSRRGAVLARDAAEKGEGLWADREAGPADLAYAALRPPTIDGGAVWFNVYRTKYLIIALDDEMGTSTEVELRPGAGLRDIRRSIAAAWPEYCSEESFTLFDVCGIRELQSVTWFTAQEGSPYIVRPKVNPIDDEVRRQ